MTPKNILLVLNLAIATYASPLVLRTDDPPANSTWVQCHEGTKDPICLAVKQPSFDVISEITHHNGTKETKHNLYTREQLQVIRKRNNVQSVKRSPGDGLQDGTADSVLDLHKRETAPPTCYTETQRWFDQKQWGYWYQSWKQVGNCFYCDSCNEAIQTSFSVTQSWTVNLGVNFDQVIQASFQFSWGNSFSLSDTRTCNWEKGDTYGCHSIWYQPLMSYHNGYANYQTHQHCNAGAGQSASDSYYNHQYTYANVNQAANPGSNGVNQGNLGCGSGCGGSDHRQCTNGNNGGALWPAANN